VTFTGLKFNATDTDSAAASLLMDLQVGGTSQFSVRKDGVTTVGNNLDIVYEGTTRVSIWPSLAQALAFRSDNFIGWSSTTTVPGTADVILGRRAAANLRLGAADTTGTTAPTPQFLSAQSWASSTTDNQTGADFTIDGSQGTGTGAGGSIIFRVAPAGGTSNGVQNALADALTIDSTKLATFGGNVTLGGTGLITGITTGASKITLDDATGAQMVYGNVVLINGGNIYLSTGGTPRFSVRSGGEVRLDQLSAIGWSGTLNNTNAALDVSLYRDAADTLALRNGTNAQESRVYGSYTATDNYQRMSIKTLRESSGALSGASYTTTIAIPAYANLIGVTTRVTTAVTGATTYDVGDGSDVDIWGAAIGIALGSQSRTADFTAVAAVGAAATSRTVTLTANGSNFTGGVVEICLHYLTTEAD
jgi:hypothetical protein